MEPRTLYFHLRAYSVLDKEQLYHLQRVKPILTYITVFYGPLRPIIDSQMWQILIRQRGP